MLIFVPHNHNAEVMFGFPHSFFTQMCVFKWTQGATLCSCLSVDAKVVGSEVFMVLLRM